LSLLNKSLQKSNAKIEICKHCKLLTYMQNTIKNKQTNHGQAKYVCRKKKEFFNGSVGTWLIPIEDYVKGPSILPENWTIPTFNMNTKPI